MNCFFIFVLTTASKVFEDRLVNRGLHAEFPDFEAVYHLVIDAVDSYNEGWERSFKEQEMLKVQFLTHCFAALNRNLTFLYLCIHTTLRQIEQAAGIVPVGVRDGHLVENKRKVFMTEKEKKEQLILKQRAELAIKKGTAELPIEVERRIELEVLQMLESELEKLMVDDSGNENEYQQQKNSDSSKKLARSHAGAVVSKSRSPGGKSSGSQQGSSTSDKTPRRLSHTKYREGGRTYDATKMNIDDLFDVFMDSGTNHAVSAQFSDDGSDGGAEQAEEPATSNEFADELLYMMRTAMSLS